MVIFGVGGHFTHVMRFCLQEKELSPNHWLSSVSEICHDPSMISGI